MSKTYKKPSFLIHYLLPFLLIWLLLALLAHFICCNGNNDKMATNNEIQNTSLAPAAIAATPFAISFADKVKMPEFTDSKNFGFMLNKFAHIEPIDNALTANLELLKEHLANNPEQRLTVTGKYLSSEEYSGVFPDLGVARANDIKEHLVGLGFNAEQINLSSKLDDTAKPDETGVLFSVSEFDVNALNDEELANEQKGLDELKQAISTAPLVLNFNTNEAQIALNTEQRAKVLDIVNYVGKTEGAKVQIIGHTDSRGDESTNRALGQQRAQFAANYLQENGLNAAVMVVSSKGELEPIADNATVEGQAKNRRTEISVK